MKVVATLAIASLGVLGCQQSITRTVVGANDVKVTVKYHDGEEVPLEGVVHVEPSRTESIVGGITLATGAVIGGIGLAIANGPAPPPCFRGSLSCWLDSSSDPRSGGWFIAGFGAVTAIVGVSLFLAGFVSRARVVRNASAVQLVPLIGQHGAGGALTLAF